MDDDYFVRIGPDAAGGWCYQVCERSDIASGLFWWPVDGEGFACETGDDYLTSGWTPFHWLARLIGYSALRRLRRTVGTVEIEKEER